MWALNLLNLHSKINSYKCHYYYLNNLFGKDYLPMLNVLDLNPQSPHFQPKCLQYAFKRIQYNTIRTMENGDGLLIRKSNINFIIFMCNPIMLWSRYSKNEQYTNICMYIGSKVAWFDFCIAYLTVSHVSDKLCQSDFMIAPIIRCMIYDWESKATTKLYVYKKANHS